jgi:copper transport protein
MLIALSAALLALALTAVPAFGHAQLLGSKPADGQTLERAPQRFVLTFDEAIDTQFVQLEVRDASGRRADRGEAYHPGGSEERVAVRLRPDVEGRIVASYRVISEDGHPVAKRTVFRVRPPEPAADEGEQGAAPGGGGGDADKGAMPGGGEAAMQEEGEIHADLSGPVTDFAFAIARGLGYLALALAIGGMIFMGVVWLPALAHCATAATPWRDVSAGFVRALRRIVILAVVMGIVATAAAIVLEAATIAGVSFWDALNADTIEAVWGTRVVDAWALRLLVWLLLGALLVGTLRPQRAPVLRRAALGAYGSALGPLPSRLVALAIALGAGVLAVTAAAAGHSWSSDPQALLVGADVVHVLSMSAWAGGLVMLLVAFVVVRRHLVAPDSTIVLAQVVGRFSGLALAVVTLLVITGATQAIALVGSFEALVDTAHGRLVLAKICLLGLLVSLGAFNRRRALPRLRRLAAGGEGPGRARTILRRTVAAEVALVLVVLAVTAVLVAAEPASG